VDFPGYGFARRSITERNRMIKRIFWYLEFASVRPKVIFLIIDANVGLTKLDWEMLQVIRKNKHNIIIVANKVDKLAKTKRVAKMAEIVEEANGMEGLEILEYSAKTSEGKEELFKKIESFL
jgi:GTP-binding protein